MKNTRLLFSLAAGLLLVSLPVTARDARDPELSGPLVGYPDVTAAQPVLGGATFEDEVMELVNQVRFDNGQLPPLKRNDLLDSSSELHSSNMAARDFFAHCDLDTMTGPGDRMTAAGYNWVSAAENIAAGQSSPASVMSSWVGSPGHLNNILSTSRVELGIGYFFQAGDQSNIRVDQSGDCQPNLLNQGPFRHYWTQNFGRRSNVFPVVINREAYMTDQAQVDLYLYGESWAVDMRLRNSDGSFTAWQPFASEVQWTLSPGSGVKEVVAEIRNGSMSVLSHSDTIMFEDTNGLIFTDGFEAGNLNLWATVVTP